MKKISPTKRINSIDALRGFALIGILLLHCIEHFDATYTLQLASSFWQKVDDNIVEIVNFLFAGKAYAIFSFLFGLSFFMQMDSQASKGNDFRLRFFWRLTILLGLGYLNGLIYMGEFFVVYAILGMFLIPLYKVPAKWLITIAILLFLQIPAVIRFVYLLNGNLPNEPTGLVVKMDQLYELAVPTFIYGSWSDVFQFNIWQGELAKWLWTINNYRYLQLIGLFIVGMLIGRSGIHKSEEKMVKYSKKLLPYSMAWFILFYSIILILPHLSIEEFALSVGTTLFKTYANLGQMMIYICGLILIYYQTNGRKALDKIAPVGRMSVTNYMVQSLTGTFIFYGYGLNCAVNCSFLVCLLIGIGIVLFQIAYSNWWIKRFYYGPMEWIWRMLTWFKKVPLRRE